MRAATAVDVDGVEPGTASAPGASAAAHQATGGNGAAGAVRKLRPDVQRDRQAIDSARAAAQSLAADGALHGAQRLLCEQLDYNLLFRWFLDLELDEASFDHSSLSANRKRLLAHEVAGEFFRGVVAQARALKLLSGEHFTGGGTLIEAWASLKS